MENFSYLFIYAAVNSGVIPQSRLDDMATRILTPYFLLKQNEVIIDSMLKCLCSYKFIKGFPATNLNSWNISLSQHVQVNTPEHNDIIRQVGAASTVLLKNDNNLLPLSSNIHNKRYININEFLTNNICWKQSILFCYYRI